MFMNLLSESNVKFYEQCPDPNSIKELVNLNPGLRFIK